MIVQNNVKLRAYEVEVVIKKLKQCVTVRASSEEAAIVYVCEKYGTRRNDVAGCIAL